MSKLDERWDRLAAGTLTEAENDELLGLADASGEAFEAYQAFKPLGPAFQKNVAAAIAAQQRQEREAGLAAAGEPDAETDDEPSLAAAPPPKRGLIFGSLAGLLGAAIAALSLLSPAVSSLPRFAAAQLAGIPATRGGEPVIAAGRPVFYPGNDLNLEATAAPQNDDLEARLYTLSAGGRLQLTNFPAKIGEKGDRVSFGPLTLGRDLSLAPGQWRLLMLLARPGKMPEEAAIRAAVADGPPESPYWQVLVFPLEVAPKPSLDEPGNP